jgi:hypothetical protein
MSFFRSEVTQAFPYASDKVFSGLLAILGPAGFKLKSQDQAIGRIRASAGISVLSWGETITLHVVATSDASTNVLVQSDLRLGVNVTGAPKNKQNTERIIAALSHYLQNGGTDPEASAAAVPSAHASPFAVGTILLLIVLAWVVTRALSS